MKETPKRYTNPFLSDEENEKVWKQELERSTIEDDKLINSLAPSEFCKEETELYTDKIVLECEVPESLISYKEGAFHVKDICVDEGIAHGEERVLFDENNNNMLKPEPLRFSTMEDYFMESNVVCSEINGKIDTALSVLEPCNDHMNIGDNCDEMITKKSDASCGTQEIDAGLPVNGPINDQHLQDSESDYKECESKEEVIDSIVPNELNGISESSVSNNGDELSDTVSKAIGNNGPEVSLQPGEKQINSSGSSFLQEDRSMPPLKSILDSIDQQPCQSHVEKISEKPIENKRAMDGNTPSNLNKTEPATSSKVDNIETLEHADEHSIEPHCAPKLQDVGSDNVPVVNPLHRNGEGESSFSVTGPISGLVTLSGPVVLMEARLFGQIAVRRAPDPLPFPYCRMNGTVVL